MVYDYSISWLSFGWLFRREFCLWVSMVCIIFGAAKSLPFLEGSRRQQSYGPIFLTKL